MSFPDLAVLKEILDFGQWAISRQDVWHPLVVHFPVALLSIVPVFLLLAMCFGKKCSQFLLSALILLLVGTGTLYLAVETGESAQRYAPRSSVVTEVIGEHAALAEASLLVFSVLTGLMVILVLADVFWAKKESRKAVLRWCYILFLFGYSYGIIVLAATAHEGGLLVHRHGVHARMPGGE